MQSLEDCTVQVPLEQVLVALEARFIDRHSGLSICRNRSKITMRLLHKDQSILIGEVKAKPQINHGPNNEWVVDRLYGALIMIAEKSCIAQRSLWIVLPEINAFTEPVI